MSELLPTMADVRAGIVHGTFCPKMCNHVCPVLAATGRETSAPWALHTLNAGVDAGGTTYGSLRGCTGCHACRRACLYDLDVPRELRATRARLVERDPPQVVTRAVDAVAAGLSPYGHELPAPPHSAPEAEVVVLGGCAGDGGELVAVARLLDAAGSDAAFAVPDGCCGRLLADLGAADEAGARIAALAERVGGRTVVAVDPHCVAALEEGGAHVVDVWTYLAALVEDGRLAFAPGSRAVTFHDPCVLARDLGVVEAPRTVLAAAGLTVREVEGHGHDTVCSGAGMGFDLLDRAEADAVAGRRCAQLDEVAAPILTGCARARVRLRDGGGADVGSALEAVAARLPDDEDLRQP